MKPHYHRRGGRFCAERRGAFTILREAPEQPIPPAAAAQRPPLRFPLKEVARIAIDHPSGVKFDA